MSYLGSAVAACVVPIISIAVWSYYVVIHDRPRTYLYKYIPVLCAISAALIFVDCIISQIRTGYTLLLCVGPRTLALIPAGIGVIAALILALAEAAFGRIHELALGAAAVAMGANMLYVVFMVMIVTMES